MDIRAESPVNRAVPDSVGKAANQPTLLTHHSTK